MITIFFQVLFFLSITMILYVYLGYPAAVWAAGRIWNRPVAKKAYEPIVSILIAAYNEERSIRQTLENKLDCDYDEDKLEIIVVSDECTDQTEDIVREFGHRGVTLLVQNPRAGKTAALNAALKKASGEILIFSDANSIYSRDAIKKIVRNFSDAKVGYVSGKMIYANPDGSIIGDGCSLYMKYENTLRSLETRIGSVVGVDGGVDAVRKELYQPMNPDQLPDFVLPLKVVEQGYRVIYEPDAILVEKTLKETGDEYRMRVRVALRALWAIRDMKQLLSVTRYRAFAWQLWSHKLLRYLCFLFMIGAYVSNWIVWSEGTFYKLTLILQTTAYIGAFLSPLLNRISNQQVLYYLYYFMLLNIASGHACLKLVLGKKQVVWNPRKG